MYILLYVILLVGNGLDTGIMFLQQLRPGNVVLVNKHIFMSGQKVKFPLFASFHASFEVTITTVLDFQYPTLVDPVFETISSYSLYDLGIFDNGTSLDGTVIWYQLPACTER